MHTATFSHSVYLLRFMLFNQLKQSFTNIFFIWRNLYIVCFLYLSKAFDSVDRKSHFCKLLHGGIGGTFFKLLYAISHKTEHLTWRHKNFLAIYRDVKQGDGLCRLLFNIFIYEPQHEISNNVVCATSKASDQPTHIRSLIRAFDSRLNILWVLSYWLNII